MVDDISVERALTRAASTLTYPNTPALRGRVLAAIAASTVPARTTRRAPRLALTGGIVAVVLGLVATISVPSSRDAVADLFGIEGSEVDVLPTPAVGVTPTPFPTPHDIDANATPSSLSAISSLLGRDVALPSGMEPHAVYVVRYGGSPAAILRFDAFDLWEAGIVGDFDGILGKSVPSAATLTELSVRGRPARWISGGPHLVQYVDASGNADEASIRTVERNTLIWRTDTALYRIETDLALPDAIAIAETLP